MAKDHPETNPITIKLETVSHAAEQFSWISLPYCSPPGYPFPIKSLALSAYVSPRTIHFRVLDKSPVSGPGRGPPSNNIVLEKTLESPLENKEIQPVYPKGNQSGAFIGKTDVEAETPILWPPEAKR